MRMDINCDMGESFGAYRMGEDELIMPFVTSINIACGWHAGDPGVMAKTVRLAARYGVAVGAHPGYPDLLGFGRRTMETLPGEIKNYVIYQIGALCGFLREYGMRLQHVKPHGALYNLAARDERTAGEIISGVKAYDPDLILVAPAGSFCAEMGVLAGLTVVREAFCDRAYLGNGHLAPRTVKGAVIHDPEKVRQRVLSLARSGRLPTLEGGQIDLAAGTLCIHGDTAGASRLAQTVRQALEEAGVEVAPMGKRS
ncbi:MAG: LamB/YcsF family protein [Syntrophobacteraceae bacterium]|nr:LamB/YcsF family protein [Syntrophobacteraceae bacterium]